MFLSILTISVINICIFHYLFIFFVLFLSSSKSTYVLHNILATTDAMSLALTFHSLSLLLVRTPTQDQMKEQNKLF